MGTKKNNVIMIICDELRADALGFMGNDRIRTPHLDALAADSIVFNNAYCSSPICIPSRVTLATGRHPLGHGVLDNFLIPMEGEHSLYQSLADGGYKTVNVGKWHTNARDDFGMKTNITSIPCLDQKVTCFGVKDRKLREMSAGTKNPGIISLIIHGERPVPEDETVDTQFTNEFLNQIEKASKQEQPSFLRLSLMDPHSPYMACRKYLDMYPWQSMELPPSFNAPLDKKPVTHRIFHELRGFDRLKEEDYRKSKACYYGLVTHNDDRIGRVISKLKDLDMYDDSLIIFTADHGSMNGEFGYIEKWGHMYEPVARIPFFIKLPNQEAPPGYKDTFMDNADIMPTVLDYLDIEIPSNVHGKSLLPCIKGETSEHRKEAHSLFYCGGLHDEPALMIRDDKWKYTEYPAQESVEKGLPIDHYLKNTQYFDNLVDGELYDMENDPYEMDNLFEKAEYRELRDRYAGKLKDYIESLGPRADYSEHKVVENQWGFHRQITADHNNRLSKIPIRGQFHGRK